MDKEISKVRKLLGIEVVHAAGGSQIGRVLCGHKRTSNMKRARDAINSYDYFNKVTCKRCLKTALIHILITAEFYEMRMQQV